MDQLLAILTPIALVDSTSVTPLGLVPLITFLSGRTPYRTALGFLSGLFVSYLVMALAFLYGMGSLLNRLNAWLSHKWHHPEPVDFVVEILLGLVLLFFGLKIAEKRQVKGQERKAPTEATPTAAFGFGFMINVVGFPGALPYFAAADQIVKAGLPVKQSILVVVFYVLIFVLPLSILTILHRIAGPRINTLLQAFNRFFSVWGQRLAMVLMILLGVLMVLDGGLYFWRGEPLVPIGIPGSG